MNCLVDIARIAVGDARVNEKKLFDCIRRDIHFYLMFRNFERILIARIAIEIINLSKSLNRVGYRLIEIGNAECALFHGANQRKLGERVLIDKAE